MSVDDSDSCSEGYESAVEEQDRNDEWYETNKQHSERWGLQTHSRQRPKHGDVSMIRTYGNTTVVGSSQVVMGDIIHHHYHFPDIDAQKLAMILDVRASLENPSLLEPEANTGSSKILPPTPAHINLADALRFDLIAYIEGAAYTESLTPSYKIWPVPLPSLRKFFNERQGCVKALIDQEPRKSKLISLEILIERKASLLACMLLTGARNYLPILLSA